MRKILITGGSGFIGTNVVAHFLSLGFEVRNVDFCFPRCKSHEKYWINIDILDFARFRECVLEFVPDYIIHLAARADLGGKSIQDYPANVQGVLNLMSIIKELKDLKKVLITSSMLVCRRSYTPKNMFDFNPDTPYGESKVQTENAVWKNEPECDWAIIRPASIWGPWFASPYRDFFDMVLSQKYYHIGKRGCTKTYGFVGNSVYQIENILLKDTSDKNNKVFYIGDSPGTNIEEWANEIAFEENCKIRRIPFVVMQVASMVGDLLGIFSIPFPMTTFRLKNMTTDNIVFLENTNYLAPNSPYSRIQGIKTTLSWLKDH